MSAWTPDSEGSSGGSLGRKEGGVLWSNVRGVLGGPNKIALGLYVPPMENLDQMVQQRNTNPIHQNVFIGLNISICPNLQLCFTCLDILMDEKDDEVGEMGKRRSSL